MSRDIPESDWRHFKRVHELLLERYLRLWKLLKKRDKELGLAFDDFRRSTAVMQLAIMRSMDLLTDEDLNVFTPQTQETVRGIASFRAGSPGRRIARLIRHPSG